MKTCKHFVIYERASGVILRTGSVPILPAEMDICMARAQVNNASEWFIETEAQIDPNRWRVDLATSTVVPL
jgi:hypothetical protein